MSEISLVEVVMFKYQKGDKNVGGFLENELTMTYPHWETSTEELSELDKCGHPFYEDVIFIEDAYGFQFTFFGDNFDGEYASGLDWEFEYIRDEVFESFVDDLIKIGNTLIDEFHEKQKSRFNPIENQKVVRFVTAWEYNSWKDSYYNEFDSDWELLGLVRMNRIKEIVE